MNETYFHVSTEGQMMLLVNFCHLLDVFLLQQTFIDLFCPQIWEQFTTASIPIGGPYSPT